MELQKINYKNEKLNVEMNCYTNVNNRIWFRGKEIALILGYKDTKKAIKQHVHIDDRILIDFKIQTHSKDHNSTGGEMPPVAETQEKTRKCIFVNESGFYSLILSSKLKIAVRFKRWVTNKVLPSIRKRGFYKFNNKNDVIETENDLHFKVVSFIRDKFPEALMIAGLGENQTTDSLRIESWRKGYMSGQCDLMIMNPTSRYSSFCIEFKDPKGNNHLSEKQIKMKYLYEKNKCRYLMSRSITDLIFEIIRHMDESNRYIKNRLKRNPSCG